MKGQWYINVTKKRRRQERQIGDSYQNMEQKESWKWPFTGLIPIPISKYTERPKHKTRTKNKHIPRRLLSLPVWQISSEKKNQSKFSSPIQYARKKNTSFLAEGTVWKLKRQTDFFLSLFLEAEQIYIFLVGLKLAQETHFSVFFFLLCSVWMGVLEEEEDMFLVVLEFISFSSASAAAAAVAVLATITRGRSRFLMWKDKATLVMNEVPSDCHSVNPRLFMGFHRWEITM